MPIHDWSRVDAGIFHHFHQSWIGSIARTLNDGVLPSGYYALKEQFAAGLGPDVLKLQPIAETDMAFYRRKQNVVAVRHVSGDRVVVVVEIVSPGDKAAQRPQTALTLAAYECGNTLRAYVLHPAIGDQLPEMPLFLEPGQAVSVPLESTYIDAFNELPRRWQRVLS